MVKNIEPQRSPERERKVPWRKQVLAKCSAFCCFLAVVALTTNPVFYILVFVYFKGSGV
jgi:hypothetical protein